MSRTVHQTVRFHVEALTLAQRIRTRANELWKQDGSLEGCADEYWRQARHLVELEVDTEVAVNGNGRVAEQNEPDTASGRRNVA
jgi:Protein of unknown function (DUF2934)